MRLLLVLLLMVGLFAPAIGQTLDPVIHEGTIEASPEAVWEAWATSEGLSSWMAPHADIDLRVGGLMRANYDADGTLGDDQTIENRILSFEPGHMLSIQVAKPPAGFPFSQAVSSMWSVVYVEPEESGTTRLRIVSMGFDASDESQAMRAFFERGNAVTLRALQAHFASQPR